jgi:hypothetical protein
MSFADCINLKISSTQTQIITIFFIRLQRIWILSAFPSKNYEAPAAYYSALKCPYFPTFLCWLALLCHHTILVCCCHFYHHHHRRQNLFMFQALLKFNRSSVATYWTASVCEIHPAWMSILPCKPDQVHKNVGCSSLCNCEGTIYSVVYHTPTTNHRG